MARGPRSENPPCPPLTPSSCLTGQAMPRLAAIKSLPATVSSTSHLPPSPSRSLAAWHSSGQGGPIDQMSARGGTGKVQAAARRVSARTSLPCPALCTPCRKCQNRCEGHRSVPRNVQLSAPPPKAASGSGHQKSESYKTQFESQS